MLYDFKIIQIHTKDRNKLSFKIDRLHREAFKINLE